MFKTDDTENFLTLKNDNTKSVLRLKTTKPN